MVASACEKCLCCTPCRQECGCAAGQDETENELVFKVLGIVGWDPKLVAAQEKRERFEEEEKELNAAKCGISKDMEGTESSEEENDECDLEEAVLEEEEDEEDD